MLSVPVLGTEHMLSSHSLPFLETSDMCKMRRDDIMVPALIPNGFLSFLFLLALLDDVTKHKESHTVNVGHSYSSWMLRLHVFLSIVV